jgi:DNA-binding transcriptional MerR regulator
MGTFYTIGQLAKDAHVPTSTVRYYERVGLLQPEGRSSGNYRVYGSAALKRLRFIRAAQATGFTLDDVTALLSLRDGMTAPCKEVQTLIEDRLADMEQRLADLQHVQRVLKSSLKLCRRSERSGRCRMIDDLSAAAGS